MDVMKLKLSTKFMRSIVAKLLMKFVQKKLGYKVNINLHELDVQVIDGETKILTSVEVNLSNDEFKKIMTNLAEDD